MVLPILPVLSIQNLVDLYGDGLDIDGECSICDHKECLKIKRLMTRPPKVLSIEIHRFLYGQRDEHGFIKKSQVSVPITSLLKIKGNEETFYFRNPCVAYHLGASARSGHYTCHVPLHNNFYGYMDDLVGILMELSYNSLIT